jgi:hypothetical protein
VQRNLEELAQPLDGAVSLVGAALLDASVDAAR